MAQENGNIDDIIEQIVCTSLLGDKEYQNTEDKSKRRLLRDKSKAEIIMNIDIISKSIKKELPRELDALGNVEYLVATQMLNQIERNNSTPITQIKINDEQILEDIYSRNNRSHDFNEKLMEENLNLYIGSENGDEKLNNEKYIDGLNNKISNTRSTIFENGGNLNATSEQKRDAVMMIGSKKFINYLKQGKSYQDLDAIDACELIGVIEALKRNGDLESANNLINKFQIPEEKLSEKSGITVNNKGVETTEQLEEQNRIADMSADIKFMFEEFPKMSPSKRKEQFSQKIEELKNDPLGIDSILYFISQEANKDIMKHPEFGELIQHLSNELVNPNSIFEIDGYNMLYTIQGLVELEKNGIKGGNTLLESFNSRLDEKHKITQEMIDLPLNDRNVSHQYSQIFYEDTRALQGDNALDNFMIEIKERIERGKSVTENEKKASKSINTNTQNKISVSPVFVEETLQNLFEEKTDCKLESCHTLARNLIINASEEEKELTIQAALAYFEKQEYEGKNKNSEKMTRVGFYKTIIESGVENPAIFEKMKEKDSEALLMAANLVKKQNESKTFAEKIIEQLENDDKEKNSDSKIFSASDVDIGELAEKIGQKGLTEYDDESR